MSRAARTVDLCTLLKKIIVVQNYLSLFMNEFLLRIEFGRLKTSTMVSKSKRKKKKLWVESNDPGKARTWAD